MGAGAPVLVGAVSHPTLHDTPKTTRDNDPTTGHDDPTTVLVEMWRLSHLAFFPMFADVIKRRAHFGRRFKMQFFAIASCQF